MLSLYFLGTPHIESNGKVIEFDTRKAVALLAYLVVTGETYHRDSLAALLWPELDQVRARAALRRTLSTLKKAIPEGCLFTARETISTNKKSIWLDISEFHDRLAACSTKGYAESVDCVECVAHLKAAVDLYRGDFLSGFTLRDSASFDDWQFFQSESLRRELAQALEKLSVCLSDQGEFEEAILYSRRWLSIDPLHEKAHRHLMSLYAFSGRRDASLRQYQECVRILDEELGVAPLEDTVSLYQEIKENRIVVPNPGHALKIETAPKKLIENSDQKQLGMSRIESSQVPLTGRNIEWSNLLGLYHILSADGHFVLIEGETGIGKTRLAEEFLAHAIAQGAEIVQARCYEGERNLSFGPIEEGLRHTLQQTTTTGWLNDLPSAWLAEVARLLPELRDLRQDLPSISQFENPGAQSRFFEAIDRFLLALLQGPAMGILFLDDLQWADNATLDLLNYLVRRRKGRPYFILATCRREDLVSDHPLQQLTRDAKRMGYATQISLERLNQAEVTSLVNSISESRFSQSITRRLFLETEGLPFFLVEYLSELLEGDWSEESREWTLPGSIRDLLHARLDEVSETGRQLLTTAAVIGRSFGFDTLREASGRGEEETISGLENLVKKGFIEEVTDLGDELEPFYDFRHEKLRALVYEETGSARRRLLHRRVAEALASRSRFQQASTRLAGQIAYHFRLGGETAEASRYFKAAGEFARSIHANTDALNHFTTALELGFPDRLSLYEAIADLQTLLGDYSAALQNYSNALSGSSSFSRIEHKIGKVYQRQGEWDQSEKHYLAALEALSGEESAGERARIMADLSLVAFHCAERTKAEDIALKALDFAKKDEDSYAESQSHNILGILARSEGEFETAIHHLERSLAIAEQFQDSEMRIAALNNLALIYGTGKDLNKAFALTEEALNLCILLGDRHREAALHSNLADILHKTDRHEEAIEHLKKSVVIFAEIGDNAEDLNPEVWKLVDW
jgi:predicted ATPase/DNA-binding SARP family transcriptional activator